MSDYKFDIQSSCFTNEQLGFDHFTQDQKDRRLKGLFLMFNSKM